MMPLSPLSSAVAFIALAAASVAASIWVAAIDPGAVAFQVLLLGLLGLAAAFCLVSYRSQRTLEELTAALARGELEKRSILFKTRGPVLQTANNVNDLLDRTEAFMRESMDMLKAVNEGRYYRRISTTGLQGEFRIRADIINENVNVIASRMHAFDTLTGSFDSDMADIVEMVCAGTARLDDVAKHVARSTEDSLTNTAGVAAAVDELSTSIHNIEGHVCQTASGSQEIVQEASATMVSVQDLANSTQSIVDMLAEIEEIAGRTNLLALNATVEAARAGEAGRGFSIVAQSVKDLADQTAQITESVRKHVDSISQSSVVAINAMGDIEKRIQSMSESTAAIAEAIRGQTQATDEIGQRAQDTAALSRAVADAIGRTDADQVDAASVIGTAKQLATNTEKMKVSLERYIHAARSVTGRPQPA